MSEDLSWLSCYDCFCTRTYEIFGLLQFTFSSFISVHTKKQLYIGLARSQLLYCSLIWRPHLIKDIVSLETIQSRATKFILGSHSLKYRDWLVVLKLFPLMYYFDLNDPFFFIANLINKPTNFLCSLMSHSQLFLHHQLLMVN